VKNMTADKALEYEKIYEKYTLSKKILFHAMYLGFSLLGIDGLAYFENRGVLIIGSMVYAFIFLLYLYVIYFYFRNQELAKKADGLLLFVLAYFAVLCASISVICGMLTKSRLLIIVYVVFTLLTMWLSYIKHSRSFSSNIELYMKEKQIDIKRGVHNIAKKKGRDRWSRILYPKSYDKKQSGLNNTLIFKWSFILNAVVIALCEYFSEDFKLFLVSVLSYGVCLYIVYVVVFYCIVLRFILRMEKEHGYEFRMVYEPDPEPTKKEPTRAQKRKRERMLAREQQTRNKRN